MERKDQRVLGVGELPPQPHAPSSNNALNQRDKRVDFNVPMGSKNPKPPPLLNKSLVINEPEASSRVIERSTRLLILDKAVEDELKHAHENNPNLDTKKIRRTVSNRLSAERSRIKRSQYINALEQKIAMLQDNIGMLSPMVDHYKDKKNSLVMEKYALEQRLSNCIMQANLRNMEIEEKSRERDMLEEVVKSQQIINDDSFFTKFQTQVVEGTSLEHYAELQMQEDMATMGDQFLNYDAMNVQPPNHFPF